MAGNLAIFYNTAVELCNRTNPPCLYSMDYETASPINGLVRRLGGIFTYDPWYTSLTGNIQYFDCSGLVGHCLSVAGYTEGNLGFTTNSEKEVFESIGWTVYDYYPGMELQKGDVLWYDRSGEGHTEIVFDEDSRLTMGASGRGSAWGYEPTKLAEDNVRIATFNTDTWYSWQYLARDESAGVAQLTWRDGNRYFTDYGKDFENNAYIIASTLVRDGYSMQAVCGILGNMVQESTLCPDFIERNTGEIGADGYGLVQWTSSDSTGNPYYKHIRYFGMEDNYTNQCLLIKKECTTENTDVKEWWNIPQPYPAIVPFTDFETWIKRTDYSAEDMAQSFAYYYLRPYGYEPSLNMPRRRAMANYFYEKFKGGIFNGEFAFNAGSNADAHRMLFLYDYRRRQLLGKTL